MVEHVRLKRYRQRVKQYRQNRIFQNKREFYQQFRGNDTKTYQQLDAREAEQFLSKIYGNQEKIKKAEWISNMAKKLGLQEGPKAKIHRIIQNNKNYQIRKRQAMMEYMDSGSRNSSPFMTD